MNIIEWLRIIFIGVVEGITEWLPISSTGHMILVNEIWKTNTPNIMTESFFSMFEVVIQLGAIFAVVTIFFNKLNPFSSKKNKDEKVDTVNIWIKAIIGCFPAAVIGILFDDFLDKYLYNSYVVAAMLIIYGILFILIENKNSSNKFKINSFKDLDYKTVLFIGAFQVLALIPGTSRSGVTILGAMMLGLSRYLAAEYTFFLAIPVMFGASFLKIIKYLKAGNEFLSIQVSILLLGMAVAYVVSIFAIKFLMNYIKKHNFKVFGYYRIILGILVLVYFSLLS